MPPHVGAYMINPDEPLIHRAEDHRGFPGALVLAVCVMIRLLKGGWQQKVVPCCAILVLLSGPANALFNTMHSMPVSLLSVIGSFLLFGLGTVAALTKHRWHHPPVEHKTHL